MQTWSFTDNQVSGYLYCGNLLKFCSNTLLRSVIYASLQSVATLQFLERPAIFQLGRWIVQFLTRWRNAELFSFIYRWLPLFVLWIIYGGLQYIFSFMFHMQWRIFLLNALVFTNLHSLTFLSRVSLLLWPKTGWVGWTLSWSGMNETWLP